MIQMFLYREPYMMFDEENDSGGGDGKETTSQTTDDIKKELDAMVESLGGTTTPNVKNSDEIELDLDMQDGDKKVEKKKEEQVAEVEEEKPKVAVQKEEEKEEDKEKFKEEETKESEIDRIRNDFKSFAETQLANAGITTDGALAEDKVVESEKKKEPVAKVEPEQPKPVELKPIELTDELFEKLRENKDEFVDFLNNREKLLSSAIKEQVLLETIPTNKKFIESYVSSINSVNQFYVKNPELDNYRPVVGFLSAKLSQENPTWDREKLFQETEKGAYKLLRLAKGKLPPENGASSGKTPGFAKGGGTRKTKPGEKVYKSDTQRELAEMAPRR